MTTVAAESFRGPAEWEAWLTEHWASAPEVWLKIAKKHSGHTSVTGDEAIDVALCFGWIDSHRRSLDETHFLQRFSRRRRRSPWSRVNVDKVAALTAAGRMREPGLAEVDAAKADGRWDAAYASQRTAEVPADLAAALKANAEAEQAFNGLGKTARYAVILPLLKARTPESRATALQRAIESLVG